MIKNPKKKQNIDNELRHKKTSLNVYKHNTHFFRDAICRLNPFPRYAKYPIIDHDLHHKREVFN